VMFVPLYGRYGFHSPDDEDGEDNTDED